MKRSSIKKEFDAFATKIAKLESLRQQLESLDVSGFEREADLIRGQLNDVNSIPAIERAMSELRNKIRSKNQHLHSSSHTHSKLAAQTKNLKKEIEQSTGALKKRIHDLEDKLAKKKQVSSKKQLSSQEVDFVRDIPHLERELHALKKEFDEHNKSKHIRVDAGVGRMVNTNFDDFISSIKSELTERLKSKELSIDEHLRADLKSREAIFAKKYQHLINEFREKYNRKVKSELEHEVRRKFNDKLHEKLDEEKRRIIDQLVQENMKRLSEERALLIRDLDTSYKDKEIALKRQMSKDRKAALKDLSQKRANLGKRIKSFLSKEAGLRRKSASMDRVVARQKAIFDSKENELEKARINLESKLKGKEKEMLRNLRAERNEKEKQLLMIKKSLEQESKDLKSKKHELILRFDSQRKKLGDEFANKQASVEQDARNKIKASHMQIEEERKNLMSEVDSQRKKMLADRTRLESSRKSLKASIEREKRSLEADLINKLKAKEAGMNEKFKSREAGLKERLKSKEESVKSREESLDREVMRRTSAWRKEIAERKKTLALKERELRAMDMELKKNSAHDKILLKAKLERAKLSVKNKYRSLAKLRRALFSQVSGQKRALQAEFVKKQKKLSRSSKAEAAKKSREIKYQLKELAKAKKQFVKYASDVERERLQRLKSQSDRLEAERRALVDDRNKAHRELESMKKHEREILSSSERQMQEELQAQADANNHEFSKKVDDLKEKMKHELRSKMNLMKRENEAHVAREIQRREKILRTNLEKEYSSKLSSAIARKEQELHRRKAALEKRMIDHISKVFS